MKRNIYKRTRRHRRQPNTISNDVQQLIETLIYAAQNGLSLADVGIMVQNQLSDCMRANNKEK